MRIFRILPLITLLALLNITAGHADATTSNNYRHLIDSLRAELPGKHSAIDSLRVYEDIYDLSPMAEVVPVANKILTLARRAHNITDQLEMLQRLTVIHSRPAFFTDTQTDSALAAYEDILATMPHGQSQKAALAFIRMNRIYNAMQSVSDQRRNELMLRAVDTYAGDDKAETIDQIVHYYFIITYLGGDNPSFIRPVYYDHLSDLVRRLPYHHDGIRNFYLTQAAILFTSTGDKQRAVMADRELVRGMKAMQQRYHSKGRRFRNYDTNYYNCYRRMMVNYAALTPEEIDSIWAETKRLAERNVDVRSDMKNTRRVEGLYLLSKGHDSEALDILMPVVDHPTNKLFRNVLLRELIGAATRTGRTKDLADLQARYIKALEEVYDPANMLAQIDRQLALSKAQFRKQNEASALERNRNDRSVRHLIYGLSAALTVVLLTCLLLLWRLYSKARRLSRSLAQANASLTAERDKLRRSERDLIGARDRASKASAMKTDFINNISHEVSAPLASIVEYSQFIVDNMDDNKRQYLQQFADVVILSSELLQTLINDVLDSSAIERGEIEVNSRPESITAICNMAMANFSHRTAPGVDIRFKHDDESDSIISTDPQRVGQVLINLLSNACKFTENGSIELSYFFDEDRTHVTFAVTDTGIGIPKGKESVIFERFIKLDPHSQGAGLGLYVCTLIAKLLGGTITVDTTYSDGARFLFTIPVN